MHAFDENMFAYINMYIIFLYGISYGTSNDN